jgi:hypothetical protein
VSALTCCNAGFRVEIDSMYVCFVCAAAGIHAQDRRLGESRRLLEATAQACGHRSRSALGTMSNGLVCSETGVIIVVTEVIVRAS